MDEKEKVPATQIFEKFAEENQIGHEKLYETTIYAGSAKLVYTLRELYRSGMPRLTTAAAAPESVEDMVETDILRKTKVGLRPHQMSDSTETADELPAVRQGQIRIAEEFQALALRTLGGNEWIRILPRRL